MKAKVLLYGFATALSAMALYFPVTYFIDVSRVEIPYDLLQEEKPKYDASPKLDRLSWTAALKRDREEDFYYPVTEVSVHLNLIDSVSQAYTNRLRHFRLQTQKLNHYHYFCLRQVLDQSNVRHKIERYDDEVGVILYSNHLEALSTIVEELKKYGIQSSVHEIKRN